METKSNTSRLIPLSIQPVITELETRISEKTLNQTNYASILKKLRKFNRDHLKIFIRSPAVFIFVIEFSSNPSPNIAHFSQRNLDHTMSLLANALSITEARQLLISQTSDAQKFDFTHSIFKIISLEILDTKSDVNDCTISLVHRAIRLLANFSLEKEMLVFYSCATVVLKKTVLKIMCQLSKFGHFGQKIFRKCPKKKIK